MLLFKIIFIIVSVNINFAVSADEVKNIKLMGKAFTKIARKESPTVVYIETEKKLKVFDYFPFMDR